MKKFLLLLLILTNVVVLKAQQWIGVGGGTNGKVNALVVHNGELYVGGSFTEVGGITANGLAKWNGTIWSPVGINANNVRSLFVFNGELYSTGSFQGLGPNLCNIVKHDGNT